MNKQKRPRPKPNAKHPNTTVLKRSAEKQDKVDNILLLHPFNGRFYQDNLGKRAPERWTILDMTRARDDGVAAASAGPYANHLHLAADR